MFCIGYSKKFPGTLGSLFSFIFIWFFYSGTFLNFSIFVLFAFLTIFICDRAEKIFHKKDDQRIVLDEFVGSFVSLLFVPKSIYFYILGFILFRFFDIKKPWFIQKSKKFKGGLGVVLDDVLAGVMTSVILFVLVLLFHK